MFFCDTTVDAKNEFTTRYAFRVPDRRHEPSSMTNIFLPFPSAACSFRYAADGADGRLYDVVHQRSKLLLCTHGAGERAFCDTGTSVRRCFHVSSCSISFFFLVVSFSYSCAYPNLNERYRGWIRICLSLICAQIHAHELFSVAGVSSECRCSGSTPTPYPLKVQQLVLSVESRFLATWCNRRFSGTNKD